MKTSPLSPFQIESCAELIGNFENVMTKNRLSPNFDRLMAEIDASEPDPDQPTLEEISTMVKLARTALEKRG